MKKYIAIIALIGTAVLARAEVKDLQINGGFELLADNNLPAKWTNNDVFKEEGRLGKVTVLTEGAQEGKNCLEIKTSSWEKVHFYGPTIDGIKGGDKIKISYYVKGSGSMRSGAYVYNVKEMWIDGLTKETETIDTKDWILKEVVLEVPDKEHPTRGQISKFRPLFQVDGDASLLIDNVILSVESK